jgi:hypothetical protein
MTDRHTRITIETERILIVARRYAIHGWCDRCGTEVEFLPSDRARSLFDATSASLGERQRSSLHKGRARDGLMFVCVQSVLRFLQAASGQKNPRRGEP